MLNIVLVEPEIAQNTGNIARTCACIGAKLHLIEPMGFRLTDKKLKRAGCDYWNDVEIVHWACIERFLEVHGEDELYFFTGSSSKVFTDIEYGSDPFFLFGRESAGIDPDVLGRYPDRCLRIPMRESSRSLNLSNAAAIAAYEFMRQKGFFGLI